MTLIARIARRSAVFAIATALTLSFAACGEDGGSISDPPNGNGRPLSQMEQKLVGTWARYHGYDGSTDVFVFKSDRTVCYYEETKNGGLRDQKSYPRWELDEASPLALGRFRIVTQERGTTDIFDFTQDEVWQGGYENLAMTRSAVHAGC